MFVDHFHEISKTERVPQITTRPESFDLTIEMSAIDSLSTCLLELTGRRPYVGCHTRCCRCRNGLLSKHYG
ncbi:hypothetical protein C5688_21050 [Methylocystis sp. MitZ-2018]|nr:hypothetical protein C5688_21050 [Methylocystis sp. MitZ-2018]